MDYRKEYLLWTQKVTDPELKRELDFMEETEIENAFYRELSFGTGGLRGEIGVGTNRLNVYSVGKASQGLAVYLKTNYEQPSVVIGYDSRINSQVFAKTAAEVLAANGIKVWIWPELTPVPTVSFAVRYLNLSAGVMITASHNPSKDNGYKVYGDDGCQITTEAAKEIYQEIKKVDLFNDVKQKAFNEGLQTGMIEYVQPKVLDVFLENVKKQSVLFGDVINKNIKIVYSPLNGTGRVAVTRVLKELGYQNIILVKEQEMPDGNFPTCPFPNPEVKGAMSLGIEYAKKNDADLLLATDPDCDRVGVAVKNQQGVYMLISGNEMGVLLLDYICSQRKKHGQMPEHPVVAKSIVTTEFGKKIADYYGVETVNVLTGFKYIGELIGKMEAKQKIENFIFGYEESYGYLSGDYVRDKDGVGASVLICEMFCYYASQGIRLTDRLEQLYEKFGYCLNTQKSYKFEGAKGQEKISSLMAMLRERLKADKNAFGIFQAKEVVDYLPGINGFPSSNVLQVFFEEGHSVIVRPSGTEPKLKMYYFSCGESEEKAVHIQNSMIEAFEDCMKIK